jgi:hypothetical protein
MHFCILIKAIFPYYFYDKKAHVYYPGSLKIQRQYQSYFYFSIKHNSYAFHLI